MSNKCQTIVAVVVVGVVVEVVVVGAVVVVLLEVVLEAVVYVLVVKVVVVIANSNPKWSVTGSHVAADAPRLLKGWQRLRMPVGEA